MSFEPFGRKVPRPVNPAPQPLMMDEVPPIGDLIAVMKDDIKQVEYWRSYYYATNSDVFASTLATESFINMDELHDRRIPVAGLVVDKTVERLEIRGWGMDTDNDGKADKDDVGDSSVPEWVEEADKLMDIKVEIANQLHLDAEIAGQSFALIHPSNNENVKSSVVAVRAGEMIVSYAPGSRWPIWGARFIPGNPLPTPDKTSDAQVETVTMTVGTGGKEKKDQLWIYDSEKIVVWEGKGISNDDWKINESLGYEYPQKLQGNCPIVPYVTKSFLNPTSGIHPLIGGQKALDQLVVSDAALIEYCGFPITYTLLDKDSALENIMMLLDPKTGKNVLEKKPSALWQLVAQEVGQLEPADPMIILKRFDFYIRAVLSLGSVPQSVWQGTESDQSGETVQQEREALLSKIDERTITTVASWGRTWQMLAYARGLDDPQLVPQWKPATARDLRNAAELALLLISCGVPPEEALRGALDNDVLDKINMDLVAQPGKETIMQPTTSSGTPNPSSSGQTGAKGGNMAPGRKRGRDNA